MRIGTIMLSRRFARLFQVQNAVEHPLSYHLSPIFQIFRLDATWAGGFPTLQIIIMAASTSPPQTERGSMENWDVIITSAAFNMWFSSLLDLPSSTNCAFQNDCRSSVEGWWQGFLHIKRLTTIITLPSQQNCFPACSGSRMSGSYLAW